MVLDHYRPSGKFRAKTFLLVPLACIAAAALAWVYELAQFHIPFLFINLFITLIFGALCGVLAGWVVSSGHVRSPFFGALVALLTSGAGLVASYAFAIQRFVDAAEAAKELSTLERWLVTVLIVPDWVAGRMEAGWSIAGAPIDGPAVWLIWLGEAVMVVAMALYLVKDEARHPYCEHCERWMAKQSAGLVGHDRTSAHPFLELGDLTGLLALPVGSEEPESPALALTRFGCTTCDSDHYLSVAELTFTRDNKNQLRQNRAALASNLVLPPLARQHFTQRFGPPAG